MGAECQVLGTGSLKWVTVNKNTLLEIMKADESFISIDGYKTVIVAKELQDRL